MNVLIFGTTSCTFCNAAKRLCQTLNLEHTYLEMKNEVDFEEFEEVFGFKPRTVPQIVVDGNLIGSFNDFKNFLNQQ